MPEQFRVADVSGDVGSVVHLLQETLRGRGVTVFATIDHAAAAREVGLDLADEVVLVFGNPMVGTSLMQADPRAGYDLPLRMLVWSDGDRTRIGYEDPVTLAVRYAIDSEQETLTKLRGLLEHLVHVATSGGQTA